MNRRTSKWLPATAAALFALLAATVMMISPDPEDRPLVTVYMQSGCATCLAWLKYLNRNGFRATLGDESKWQEIRSRARLPPSFRAPHTAVVEGLFVEGHVPAREIYKVLRSRSASDVKGIVVAGTPAGAPGVNASLPEPYTVFLVHDSGLMKAIALYNHGPHL
jgi:hypothetical protein